MKQELGETVRLKTMTTDRISDDWMKQYGIARLAVETYVDSEHNDHQL